MLLTALLPPLLADADIARTVRAASSRSRTDRSLVVAPGARPAVLAAMALGEEGVQRAAGGDAPAAGSAEVSGTPLLVVTATGREAEETALALRSYLPEHDVAVMPAWETLPHERLSPRADTVAQRLSVLRRLAHPEEGGAIRVLIVPVRALLAPVIAGLGELEPVQLAPGLTVGLEETARRLEAAAYTRVDMVETRGEYAVRGGILDVFPPSEPRPVRVDFFGDEIDEVSSFAVADQRTIETLGAVTATACRELVLTDAVRERAAALADAVPGAADMLEKISQGIAVEGMESLAPVLVEKMVPLLDLVGDRLTVLLEPERVRKRAEDLTATTTEFLAAAWTSAASGGTVPVDLSAAAFAHLAEARALALSSNRGWWSFTALAAGPETTRLDLSDPHTYRGELERAVADLGRLARQGWTVVVATDGPGPGRRMAQLLGDGDVPARIVDQLSEVGELGRDGDWAPDPAAVSDDADGSAGAPTAGPGDGVVRVTQASAGHGFLAEGLRLALIAESDLTGRASAGPRERRSLPARRARRSVDPLSLHAGDLVVHAQHGVGRFIELSRRTVGGARSSATREYLVIEYAPSKRGQPGDRLLVPTDALDQVTKYVGGDSPALSKMGGADWAKTKSKARKAVREIAGELVRLYAARAATTGHAFSPDTPWQTELEEAFPYTETPDQLSTIDEVKADMEKAQPMDRLVCGDVGYGKTEIAVRAAFKAVQDGKQVAVLVPTTLLVSQHAETFTERYAGFPVTVAALSRFQD
ncbi:CarD family transcriptional regulator, partial [Actinomyces oris]